MAVSARRKLLIGFLQHTIYNREYTAEDISYLEILQKITSKHRKHRNGNGKKLNHGDMLEFKNALIGLAYIDVIYDNDAQMMLEIMSGDPLPPPPSQQVVVYESKSTEKTMSGTKPPPQLQPKPKSTDKPMSRTKKVIIGVLVGTFTSASLYEMAKKLGIKGTSNMTKMKRARAIVKHNWKKVGAVLISMGLLGVGYKAVQHHRGAKQDKQ